MEGVQTPSEKYYTRNEVNYFFPHHKVKITLAVKEGWFIVLNATYNNISKYPVKTTIYKELGQTKINTIKDKCL